MAEARYIKVRCLRDTTDGAYHYYKAEHVYTVPMDHPCMKHFEPLEDVNPADYIDEQRAKIEARAKVETPDKPIKMKDSKK